MKKVLCAAAISVGLILAASQALAADYAPGSAPAPTTIQQTMPQGASGNKVYMSAMPNGGYQMMSAQPGSMMLAYGYSRQAAWWGLLIILTVMLVWANLLLLIAFLWKQVSKHHHK